MAGRTLIYGLDGRTPLVRESELAAQTLDLLVEAFAMVTGLLMKDASNPAQVQMIANRSREKLMTGIIAMDGAVAAIEERFGVTVGIDARTGEILIHGKEETVPALPLPPRSPSNPY